MRRSGLLVGLGVLAFVFMILPVVLVVYVSFFRDSYISLPPSGYSLEWYSRMFESRQLLQGLGYSLVIATCAAVGSVALSMPAAIALSRARFHSKAVIENLLILPVVIPSIVSGLAVYIFLFELSGLAGTRLVPSTWALVLAHILITLPWAFRLTYGGMLSIGTDVERASLDLGESRWGTARRITLPLLRASLTGAAILCFIFSFGNLEISLFLIESGRTTLPVAMTQYAQFKVDPTIAAVSTVQIVLVAGLLVVIDRFVDFGTTFSGGTKK